MDDGIVTDNFPSRGQITSTADGSIKAPKSILNSVQAARSIYQQYREDHLKRIALYSHIEGLIAGNPPYDPAELQKHGLSHIANFNNLDGRALYERGCLAYWNLLHSAERFFTIGLSHQDQQAMHMADIMSDNFDKVIKKWPSFRTAINTLIAQIVKFGVSPIIWNDERDWRFRVIELQRFFVAPQAPTDTEQLTCVFVESIFTAQQIYQMYEDFKDKGMDKDDENPWNVAEIESLLIFYANSFIQSDNRVRDMMDLQQRLQGGDLSLASSFGDGIRLVSCLYREYDQKISHYMFHPEHDAGDFLFRVDSQYEALEQALIIFTASPGEFTIHSNRGVGHKIFAGCQAMMQLDCATIDMAKITSTPFIKTLSVGGQEMDPIRVYPGTPTNIGSADFVQTNFGANIQQLIGASQYMLQKMNYNAANSGDDPSTPDGSYGSLSAPQARMKSFKEFGVLKNNIQHFYSFADMVGVNILTKFLHCEEGYPGYEYIKEWKEACINQGVPKELFETKGVDKNKLPPMINIKATRVAGDGSTAALVMGIETLMPMSGSFTQKGQKELVRQGIRAVFGSDYVPAFISDIEEDAGNEVSLVAAENGLMELGKAAVAAPTNDHSTHLSGHAALANQTIQQVRQQQMTQLDADKLFSQLIPHVGEHVQLFSANMFAKSFLENFIPAWNEIQKFAEKNRVVAAQMVEAKMRQQKEDAAKQEQVMSEEQRKDMQAQKDEQRKDYKIEQQVERARNANVTRGDVMRSKVQSDAEIQREKIQLEAENNSLKTQGDVQSKQLKTQAEVRGMTQKQQLEQMNAEQLMAEQLRLIGERPAQADFEDNPLKRR